MRVCVVDPVSYTRPYDHSLSRGLADLGHEVDLVTARFQHGSPPAPDSYRLHEVFFTASARVLGSAPRSRVRFLLKGVEYGPSVLRLLRTIDRLDPEVVHVQWLGIPRLDRQWLARVARSRMVVFTAHEVFPRRWERNLELWRDIFGIVDRVVVHGQAALERVRELVAHPDRVVRIPHALFPAPPAVEITPPHGRTLLFFGLIHAAKGVDVLLRALPAIAARVPDVRLVVAGDPLVPTEPLVRIASELDVAERVEWRLRFVGDGEAAALIAAAAAVVLPYRRSESSGVLATALGHGRPVVVADVGSLGATVREFEAGVVVPPEDPAALADACVELLTIEEMRARAFEGTRRARDTLTWERAARMHERLYEEALAERAVSSPA